jgi:hypothetical protein
MSRWCFTILLLALAGCTPDYPMDKQGTWSLDSEPDNDANLHAMIVNPRDLVQGAGESNSLGQEAAPAVNRLFTGRRPPLQTESASTIYATPAAGATGGSGAAVQQ